MIVLLFGLEESLISCMKSRPNKRKIEKKLTKKSKISDFVFILNDASICLFSREDFA